MTTRKTFKSAQMRELAAGRGSQFLMDDMKAALRYAADLIEAADAVIEENRQALLKRNAGELASELLPEPTYTHEQVRAILNDISADARLFGLEIVDHLNGHLGLRKRADGVEGRKP